ncbi:MAG: hypothetical protein QME40_02365 [bacterium]|nr:hypothetical protein [bacterium]
MNGRIITHSDFDGIVSASLCSYVLKIEHIIFTSPFAIIRSLIPITDRDIVCDLPYPLKCSIWFDHHEGNLQELEHRRIDPSTIKGRFALLDSCSRVIYEYFSEKTKLPTYFEETVSEADLIDSFGYQSIEEWKRETPGSIINNSLKIGNEDQREERRYLKELTFLIRDNPIGEIISNPKIKERYNKYKDEEDRMLHIISDSSYFLPQDVGQEIVVIDLTRYNRRPNIIKNLAYLLYPNALSVLEINNLFEKGIKTNNLSFSMSLGINLNSIMKHRKNIGEIMRTLNMGDGHPGAASGRIICKSKPEMLRMKKEIIDKIYELWSSQ